MYPDLTLITSQKNRENEQPNLKAREVLFPASVAKNLLWFKTTVMIFEASQNVDIYNFHSCI